MAKLVSTQAESALREAQDYKLRSRKLLRHSSDKNARLGRLEGPVVIIAGHVSLMQEELEHHTVEIAELTKKQRVGHFVNLLVVSCGLRF